MSRAWSNDTAGDTSPELQIDKLEGERTLPGAIVLIEWPSREAAEAFYESEEYRPYRERRRAGAINEFTLLAGEDMNNLARIAG
jgi:uncharacterized protein (DUF1330 family)